MEARKQENTVLDDSTIRLSPSYFLNGKNDNVILTLCIPLTRYIQGYI